MVFNISIDSSSLDKFSSSPLHHFLQIIERTIFFKRCDFSAFSILSYLLQIAQYIFLIFLFIENDLVLLYLSYHNKQEKINLHNPAKF